MATRTLAALVLLAAPLSAQTQLPFPAVATLQQAESLELVQDHDLLDALAEEQGVVVLQGAPLPGGGVVDLELTRIDFDPRSVGVHVDGRPRVHDAGNLSLWKGELVGVTGTRVFLALSSRGSYGWVFDGVDLNHVTARPGASGRWARADMRIYSNAALEAAGPERGPRCFLDQVASGPVTPPALHGGGSPAAGGPTLECKMAVETDNQLWQIWHDLDAEINYVFALIGAVSDRFLEQLNVKITYPYVQFYTTLNDPWTTQESGGGAGDLLNEFRSAWSGNLPAGAHLAHFLSGANLGGGVAWVGTLCSQSYGFAVSGNINGGVTFPVTQGGNTWDFYVMAHEAGHNFGSPHTHDYCPPLDECAQNCNNQTNCVSTGTNMSYCHGCAGGMVNITTYFHPTAAALMRDAADASCLPELDLPGGLVIFSDDFESGDLLAGGWNTSNQPSQVLAAAAREGSFGVRIRRKRWIEKTLDTTGYTNVAVELWRKTKNYDAGERLRLRVYDGQGWHTLENATNPGWGKVRFELGSWANNNPSLLLRLRSTGSEGKERGDVDSVVVTGE